jgi:hypothetical protein
VNDPAAALAFAEDAIQRGRRSLLWSIQVLRLRVLYLRGGAALAAIEMGAKNRGALLRRASRDAQAIERERATWMRPLAAVLRAGVALHRQGAGTAASLLEAASRDFEANDMLAHAHAARERALLLRSIDHPSAELAHLAARWASLDVAAPERMRRMLLPGFGGQP